MFLGYTGMEFNGVETAACPQWAIEVLRPLREVHKDPFEKNVFDSPGAGAVFLLYCRSQLHVTSGFDHFLKLRCLCFTHLK